MSESSFGRKLKHVRKLRNVTLTELAKAAGCSASHLSNLENGVKEQPGLDIVSNISKFLKVDIRYFVEDDIESPFEVFEVAKEELPEEVKDFMLSGDLLPWVRLREMCKINDVTVEDAKAIIEAVFQIREKKNK
jgi:XRE family transcriptional regulator of biofilm formation